ncbi:MAG TPA: prolyl oligopeptidase family serine peptidase [Candidatus Cybelea sp.]|jgi:prolyl oligopeptidase|nr:prolyl oligopeptidase family serine peptidase [Candidatus Cybelea sp.]
MRRLLPITVIAIFTLAAVASAAMAPPLAPAEPVTDNYFGTSLVDPYRWMEKSPPDPRFLAYLRAQSAYTTSVLAPLSTPRDALQKKLMALSTGVAHVSDWQKAGNKLFFEELEPAASVSVLRVKEGSNEPITLLDPSRFAAAGSHVAIDYFAPSLDGTYVAVGAAAAGSEDDTIHVVDTASGRVLPEAITRTEYGGPSWREDGRSFYYSRLQALAPGASPDSIYVNQRVYLHVLGTDPEKDSVVFGPGVDPATAVPAAGFNGVNVVPSTPYLVAYHSAGTTDLATVYLGRAGSTKWITLIRPADHLATSGSQSVTTRGAKLFAVLQDDPNGRIVRYDLANPSAPPVTIVPAGERVIEGVFGAADGLYVEYRNGITFSISKLDDGGAVVGSVPLPYQGTVYGIDSSPLESGVRFGLDSWIRSPALFAYDSASAAVSDTRVIPADPLDVSHLQVREVTAPSTDGAQIPVSIIVRDDIVLDGSHPALFEGYGSYGNPWDPGFSATMLEWVLRGGVLAYAHVRGGGEYGERWHVAGQKAKKQHTIDDMIATARYLIEQKYTSPNHLAVRGTSAGGIAVGGAIVQHPELFAAAVDNVGMTNLLRFQSTQGGAANVPEFGDVTNADDFKYMYQVDAYAHVVKGVPYPAVMGVTGTHDPRVPTWMVAKMIARLQASTSSGKPVLLRVDYDAGHGFGTSRTQLMNERADEWTFLLWQLGDAEFQPRP